MPLVRYSTAFCLLLDIQDESDVVDVGEEDGEEEDDEEQGVEAREGVGDKGKKKEKKKANVYDNPDFLSHIGLTCWPSLDPRDPIPEGLTPTSSRDIAIFLNRLRQLPEDDKKAFIEHGADCSAGREAFRTWFSRKLVKHLNKRIDITLRKLNVHPSQRINRRSPNDFPSADAAALDAAPDIAVDILGFIVYEQGSPTLRDDVRPLVSGIVRMAYERMKKAWSRAKPMFESRKADAIKVMNEIEASSGVTLKLIRSAIQKVNQYKQSALLMAAEMDMIEEYEASLEELMTKVGKVTLERVGQEGLTAVAEKRASLARSRMAKKHIVEADLADEDAIERTWSLFVLVFVAAEQVATPEIPNEEEIMRWEEDLLDRGVGRFKATSSEDLSVLLGFPSNRPPSWAPFRHVDPMYNTWDHPDIFEAIRVGEDLPPDFAEVSLFWHQLVGIASIADKIFFEKQVTHVSGIILADTVGVGKTAQMMGEIAFIQLVYASECEGSNIPRPPLVGM